MQLQGRPISAAVAAEVSGTDIARPSGVGNAGPSTNGKTRDLQKEADILRWRLLHYRHKFDHVVQQANASLPVVGAMAVAQYAVELKQSKVFLQWRDIITIHSLRAEFWVAAMAVVAEEESKIAARRAEASSRANYQEWLNGGPALGLGRQHRMSRTSIGWVPTKVGTSKPLEIDAEMDDTDGLSLEELDAVTRHECSIVSPLDAQQLAEGEADGWGGIWKVGAEDDGTLANLRACDDLDIPAELLMAELVWSLMSFPNGTGLGWDRVHPKALLRADPQWIAALLKLLIRCEATGQWPQVIELVIICLLPKPDGGFRPIGLLPVLPRIWMRSRRNATQLWERRNNKSYLYAGEGKGAQVAAWQQSARAEAATRFKAAYAQGLLDLVKAFDSVPFRILVREAKKLGYSLRILRLSLLTYTMPRSLRVGMVFSRLLVARCGITAGSGTACTEMRVLMIHVVDAARLEYQLVIPTLYVDDLSAEITASRQAVHDMLVGYLRLVCRMIEEMGMEVSRTKSVCTASYPKLGRGIAAELTEYGITYVDRAKSLGAGLGGGTRRNTIVQRKRLTALQARIASFRKLRAMAIDTAKLLRTGGNSGLNYDAAITGVPPTTLHQQRITCAIIQSPVAGWSGQDVDLALIIADGSASGTTDPVFGAHLVPIGTWATAIWERWLPIALLDGSIADAKAKAVRSPRPWAVATGPATVFVLTAARLDWTVHSATSVTTDEGTRLTLHIDPPAVVKIECKRAVQRWRWRNVQRKFPSLCLGNLRGVGPTCRAYGSCSGHAKIRTDGTITSVVP